METLAVKEAKQMYAIAEHNCWDLLILRDHQLFLEGHGPDGGFIGKGGAF